MNLIMFGPPGGGKGTYSSKLSEKHEIPHIATGDIFREEIKKETRLGKKVKEYLDKGELVPDKLVNEVVKERLSKPDCKNGFILDGYPRTLKQAKALDEIEEIKIDLVINLDVADDIIINRLSNRRICKDCGEIYNLKSMPPKKEGICDECGGELYQREDDKPEVIKNRIEEYKKRSKPLLEFYSKKEIVNDIIAKEEKPVEEILKKIEEAIQQNIKN